MENLNSIQIEKMIYNVRGQKVMLDSDLAELYGVLTKNLNKAVKRNIKRFPIEFMFQLNFKELGILRFQIGTANNEYKKRYLPFVFTESGVAMLSSILNSDRSILVNISIMKTFIKMRSFLAMETGLTEKVGQLERGTNQLFKAVFERLDNLEDTLPNIPKIGKE